MISFFRNIINLFKRKEAQMPKPIPTPPSSQIQDPYTDPRYAWVWKEDSPRILVEALHWFGTLELKGDQNNPVIIEWAKEVGGWIGDWYDQDSIPWCGLFMAMVAKRAKFPFNQKALAALEWANWGQGVKTAKLGDVLVFKRKGGGHVGLYIGEDNEAYHVLGGNQSDMVNITRISKSRLHAVRRCPWRHSEPDNVRVIYLSPNGKLSINEA